MGDLGSSLELGRCPGGEYGNPLQSSCLGNPMDRGAQQATPHRVAESDMTEQLSKYNYFIIAISEALRQRSLRIFSKLQTYLDDGVFLTVYYIRCMPSNKTCAALKRLFVHCQFKEFFILLRRVVKPWVHYSSCLKNT